MEQPYTLSLEELTARNLLIAQRMQALEEQNTLLRQFNEDLKTKLTAQASTRQRLIEVFKTSVDKKKD